jgi:hypothetical protein
LSRCDNSARVSAGGTNGLEIMLPAFRCAASTRRYSSQRDEFHLTPDRPRQNLIVTAPELREIRRTMKQVPGNHSHHIHPSEMIP